MQRRPTTVKVNPVNRLGQYFKEVTLVTARWRLKIVAPGNDWRSRDHYALYPTVLESETDSSVVEKIEFDIPSASN